MEHFEAIVETLHLGQVKRSFAGLVELGFPLGLPRLEAGGRGLIVAFNAHEWSPVPAWSEPNYRQNSAII